MKPHWTNDCEHGCRYMGTTFDDHGRFVDWYVHAPYKHSTSADITVVGRYGNEPSHYWSCPQFILDDPRHDVATVMSTGENARSTMRIVAQYFLLRWKQGLAFPL